MKALFFPVLRIALLTLACLALPPLTWTQAGAWTQAAGVQPKALVAASSPDGSCRAWIANDGRGLFLTGWGDSPGNDAATLILGQGGFPRFDRAGDFYFELGQDDGHRLLSRETMWLPKGSFTPRPLGPGQIAPPKSPGRAQPSHRSGADLAAPIKICIDAGHGGTCPGALAFGYREADFNLDVALRLAELLEADSNDSAGGGDWDVLLTRFDDSTVSLCTRVALANAFVADRFLSIHTNSFTSASANGTETYAFQESTIAAAMRDLVQDEMVQAWGLTDRGSKTANFFVLLNTTMPASLSEMGFITNLVDLAFLSDPCQRERMALAHLFALQRHFGLAPFDPSPSLGSLKGVLHDASGGVTNPIEGALVTLSDGSFELSDQAGNYRFDLSPGTFGVAATAPGFDPVERAVTIQSGCAVVDLPLLSANLPALVLDSVPPAGGNLDVTLSGDVGAVGLLLYSPQPGLPLVQVGQFGTVWVDLNSAGIEILAPIPASGSPTSSFVAPAVAGTIFHCQALIAQNGVLVLSNGAAFQSR